MGTNARITEAWLELPSGTTASGRVTEVWLEIYDGTLARGRVTEAFLETMETQLAEGRATEAWLEIMQSVDQRQSMIISDPARIVESARYFRTGGRRKL